MTNPVIEEVRAARASIAAEHGYDRAKNFSLGAR
jgi:hypothetical protein